MSILATKRTREDREQSNVLQPNRDDSQPKKLLCCFRQYQLPRDRMNIQSLNKLNCPTTGHKGAWAERKYSSYSFLASELEWVSGQRHAPSSL
jgi:hypothetical protein